MDRLTSSVSPLLDVLDSRSYAVVALAAVIAAILVVALSGSRQAKSAIAVKARSKDGRATILFVGPMASGKTSFFGRLVYSQAPPTHTSMTSSSAAVPDRNIQLVDLPGHPRLRSHLLSQYLSAADGVVFFIDPQLNGNSQGIQATAEHLHVLLSLIRTLEDRSSGKKAAVPVLLLLTKSDAWSVIQRQRAKDRVKSALERELEKRRKASSGVAAAQARLESIDELPSTAASGPFSFFGLFGSQAAAAKAPAGAGNIKLPEDEQEILQSDVLDYDGPLSWDEDKLGICIDWATSSCKAASTTGDDEKLSNGIDGDCVAASVEDGTAGFWNWVDARVL